MKCEGRSGVRTRLSKQAALTTVPGPLPWRITKSDYILIRNDQAVNFNLTTYLC